MPFQMPKTWKAVRRNLARGSIALGVLGLSVGTVAQPAQAQSQRAQQYVNVFFAQGYGWCDARKLSKIWRVSPSRAKVIAGEKISYGNISIVRRDWSRGVRFFQRFGFSCGQSSLPGDEQQKFTYNDADAVARAWSSNKS
jgi:hypothetical protein